MKGLGQIRKEGNEHGDQHFAFIVDWFCLFAHDIIHTKHCFVRKHRSAQAFVTWI